MNNVNKRTFLNLDYIKGEGIELIFSITDDYVQLTLAEYTFVGAVKEEFNDTVVATFCFKEHEGNPDYWVAYLDGLVTESLTPQTYEYEIRMQGLDDQPDTILYGTLTLRPNRLGT